MRRVVVLAVVAGCGKPPPPRVSAPQPVVDATAPAGDIVVDASPPMPLALPRPEALFASLAADPEPVLRWPLPFGIHPDLEPSFEIANALAEPGIGWIELCRMGAQHRTNAKLRELTQYLRAWCEVGDDKHSAGLTTMLPLTRAFDPKLAAAARADVVNILAAGSAVDAERLMTYHRLFTLERMDLLAATFVELGKEADALVINNRALASDRVANRADTCRRLARSVMLEEPVLREGPLEKLHGYAQDEEKNPADPVCVELYEELSCWLDQQTMTRRASCGAFWLRRGLPPNAWGIHHASRIWPEGEAGPAAWLGVARLVAQSLEVHGADGLLLDTLEATLRTAACSGPHVRAALDLAKRVATPPRPPIDETRLRRIIDRPREVCTRK
ncbi:MAG: hypothetical protein SFX73_30080 [Kofleriaceae bacterium]|nr:hypothetical protein [Kofleriaceae bacterium]